MTESGRFAKMTSQSIETGQVWTRIRTYKRPLKGDVHNVTAVRIVGIQMTEPPLIVHINLRKPAAPPQETELEEFVASFQLSHLGMNHPMAKWESGDNAALTFEGEPTGYRGRGRPPKNLGHRPPTPPRKKPKEK